jgi:hypothetical protein
VLRRSGVPFEKSGLRRVTLSRLMPCVLLVVPVRRQDELGQDHRRPGSEVGVLTTQSFPDEMTEIHYTWMMIGRSSLVQPCEILHDHRERCGEKKEKMQ